MENNVITKYHLYSRPYTDTEGMAINQFTNRAIIYLNVEVSLYYWSFNFWRFRLYGGKRVKMLG